MSTMPSSTFADIGAPTDTAKFFSTKSVKFDLSEPL